MKGGAVPMRLARPSLRRAAAFAGLFCLACAFVVGLFYHAKVARLTEGVKEATREAARRGAAQLDADLSRFLPVTSALVADLEAGRLAGTAEIEARLRATLESNPNYEGVGVAFAPEALSGGRFARYCYRGSAAIGLLAIESRYDYAAGGNLFYDKPMKDGAGWLEPHYTRATRQLVAEYAEPFTLKRPDGTPYRAGIVFLNYAMGGVKRIMADLDLGRLGYAFLVSREGAFIAHPMDEWVRSHKTLAAAAADQRSEALAAFAREAAAGRPAEASYLNELSGQTTWVRGVPVPATGWTLGVVSFPDDVRVEQRARRRAFIDLVTLAALGIVLLLLSRAPVDSFLAEESDDDLWRLSSGISLALVAAILLIWAVVNSGEHEDWGEEPPVLNRSSLERIKEDHLAMSRGMRLPDPLFIPTGLFVQSLEFVGANNVRVTGYVWQKFTDGLHDEVKRGVVFPEADATDQFEERYRVRNGPVETVGWYFEMSLRQAFDYRTYPFDQENVWFRLWPAEFWRNVMLEPDLASYPVVTPSTLPGVEKEFVLNGWQLENTYWSYGDVACNTRFGLGGENEPARVPELHFNLLMRRAFMNPFITDVLPLAVVFVMLFAALLAVTRDSSINELLGFSSNTLIGTCAAFFFAVLLAHTQLRDRLQIPHIIYIEHFYFISYVTLLLVTVDGLLCAFPERFPRLARRDNLSAKVLYFPLALLLVLAVTIWTFR